MHNSSSSSSTAGWVCGHSTVSRRPAAASTAAKHSPWHHGHTACSRHKHMQLDIRRGAAAGCCCCCTSRRVCSCLHASKAAAAATRQRSCGSLLPPKQHELQQRVRAAAHVPCLGLAAAQALQLCRLHVPHTVCAGIASSKRSMGNASNHQHGASLTSPGACAKLPLPHLAA